MRPYFHRDDSAALPGALLTLAIAAPRAMAQGFPSKPMRWIVTAAPGGAAHPPKQAMVLENRSSASGCPNLPRNAECSLPGFDADPMRLGNFVKSAGTRVDR